MGLLQRKPIAETSSPLYTLASSKTILIIGLGNPGKEYANTRHNIGFAILDDFASRNEFPNWTEKKDLKCQITSTAMGNNKVILAKPTTFMNVSGEAAQALQRFYKVDNASTVVVYDELAINFGQIRARVGGEAAGHNGIKSLIQHIGDDFGRLRVGIANDFSGKADASDFVLGRFTKEEQGKLDPIIKESGVMLTEYIFGGSLPHETRSILL